MTLADPPTARPHHQQSPPLPVEHCRLALLQLVATAEAAGTLAEVARGEMLTAGAGCNTDRIKAETDRLKAAAMMVRSEKMKIDAETERLKAEAVGIKVVADTVAGMDVAGSVRETQKKEVERLTVGVERVVAATVKAPKKVEETKRKNSEKAVKKVGETTRKTSEKERAVVPKLPKR